MKLPNLDFTHTPTIRRIQDEAAALKAKQDAKLSFTEATGISKLERYYIDEAHSSYYATVHGMSIPISSNEYYELKDYVQTSIRFDTGD